MAKTGAFVTATLAEAAMPFGKQAFKNERPILPPKRSARSAAGGEH